MKRWEKLLRGQLSATDILQPWTTESTSRTIPVLFDDFVVTFNANLHRNNCEHTWVLDAYNLTLYSTDYVNNKYKKHVLAAALEYLVEEIKE